MLIATLFHFRVTHLLLEDDAFATELETWCEERCKLFDLAQEDDEHSLEYTDLHTQFCMLFEKQIESFLDSEGYSTTEFWQKLTKAVDDDHPMEGEGFTLEALKITTDYCQFASTMRQMRRQSAGT